MLKEKNINKILSGCVVFIMLLSAFFVITPVNIVATETNDTEPSIRIYGEDNAVYPTQSYYDSNDFIYPEEFDPFDPGIIEKDSITFNSAFWFGHNEYEIKARGDASEKIFLRAFYEPGYYHGVDSKMDDCSNVALLPVEQFDAIVTETTYFLTTLYDRDPTYGYPGETKIALPYVSNNPDIPGMDEAGLLNMVWADDDTSDPITGYTDGAIAVEKEYTFDNVDYNKDIIINFMDHKVVIDNFEDNDPLNDKLDFTIYYVGNMYDQASAPAQHTILESFWGFNYFFDRDNHIQSDTDPCHRWYIRIENADDDYLRITVGRVLEAGETFYVDGVRYDMPAIYVDYDNDRDMPVFKYITFQSPIPKGSPMWNNILSYNVDDFSHVTSQYLASLDPYEIAWLLPPFNEDHMMIDDIGFDSNCLPEAGILLDAIKEPLEFYYIEEDIEGRFDSSLAERVETIGVNEYWYWYNVYTQPNHYTEFILPNQETTSDYYDTDDLNWQGESYIMADGNEYLITTSFIAPNSEVNLDRSNECKTYDEHEIYDRVITIALYGERSDYYQMPRYVFEFDAYNDIDFFVNEGINEPSIRIYGEDNAVYPTQSYTGANDFVYSDESDPFDPGMIKKDSITFNPAFIYGHDGVYEIKAQGDASEKIFLRLFYEPGYSHTIDSLMDACSGEILQPVEQFDAIVTETTYFLTTLDTREPTVGYPLDTKVVLPYKSANKDIPGMEEAGLLDLVYTEFNPLQLTDGYIAVEKEFKFTDGSYIGAPLYFMDHKVVIDNFENNDPLVDKLDYTISYTGNMYEAISSPQSYTITEDFWNLGIPIFFDRENEITYNLDDPCYRWYLRVQNADDDYLRIYLGRVLVAGETFYVDGMRYDMPAIYVDQTGGFKYITFQSPIPKGSPMWQYPLYKNVDDFSHVSSQYLASLDPYEIVWLLPPFNENHIMIDDIGLQKIRGNCLPPEGVMLDDIKESLEFYYIAEDIEGRFDTSLVERLHTTGSDSVGYEEWEAYNVYTQPNHYTEFVLPDQETTSDYYDTNDCTMVGYSYSIADGNEYLITSSLIAPNSNMNLQRSNICKKSPYEHEIFSALDAEDGGTAPTQFAMIIDGSGSIDSSEWNLMLDGIYNAVQFNMPHDGSVEFTVVQFADYIDPDDAKVEVGPVIVTEDNYNDVANQVMAITHMYDLTPLSAGINVATQALLPTASQYTRHVVNIVTDGGPNVPTDAYGAAEDAIANMVSTLGFDPAVDEIDVEGIALTPDDFSWMRDNIVWPQPGDDTWPPTKPGWIRSVSNYQEFSDTIAEKFDIIFIHYAPRLAYEFDANDGTGIYINSVVPPTYPPTASACSGSVVDSLSTLVVECGYTGNCEDPVIFNGGGSYDNDENGEKIVTYQWDFGDGATGTGKTPQHIYTCEGTYTVILTVTDDEGEQDTDTAYVDIYCDEEPLEDEACVSMGSVNIDCGYGISYAYLRAQYITEEVGSGSFHICFDSDEIHVASVDQSDFDTPITSWDNDNGDLFISGLMNSGNSLTGDFIIARIGFVRVDEAELGCDLIICASELLTDNPSTPVLIDHTKIDGCADINCDNPSDGDMNGDGFVNSGDVRYIAIYVASGGNDPNYKPLHADGDVNNDHKLNSGDIRYLAIFEASGGMDPDYSPLYP